MRCPYFFVRVSNLLLTNTPKCATGTFLMELRLYNLRQVPSTAQLRVSVSSHHPLSHIDIFRAIDYDRGEESPTKETLQCLLYT